MGGQDGCERNVGGRGDVGYGGCEPRIEGIIQCTKRYCTILRKFKKMGGGGAEGQYLNPKHSQCIKKKVKKIDRAGIRTHDLQVRKTCSLIH